MISFPFVLDRLRCDFHSGVSKYRLCSLAQYINLVGVTIGYTITTAISMGYASSTRILSSLTPISFASVSGTTTARSSHVSRWYANQLAGRALSL